MTISVDPQVFGSPLITWVAVFTLAGIVVGLFLILRYGAATRQRREVYSIGLWAILWGLVGARALDVFFQPAFARPHLPPRVSSTRWRWRGRPASS